MTSSACQSVKTSLIRFRKWITRVNSSSSTAEAFDRGGRDVSEREPVSAGGAASTCRPDNKSRSDSIGANGCKLMAGGEAGARLTVCGSPFWAGVTQPWPSRPVGMGCGAWLAESGGPRSEPPGRPESEAARDWKA